MAKDLSALVRLNDWEVDQKRRLLADELVKLDTLEIALQNLLAEMAREQAAATNTPTEGGITYAAYASHAMDRRDNLIDAIRIQEEHVEVAREVLREAFLEFKKYEITEDRRLVREERERAKYEQDYLDEVGIGIYTRKNR